MKSFSLFLILFLLSSAATLAQTDPEILRGELNGSPYTIALPAAWQSGNLFFHVHGWRPAEAPHEADLDTDDPFYRFLLENGWAIARTAFRENGVNHDAHTADIEILKSWIHNEISTVQRVILEGESTAATLVLRIAECNPDLADGVIAKGAFVNLNDREADSFLEATPGIPAILMSNLTELDGPVAYVASAENAPVRPVLRPLLNPGHVNVNWMERRDAFLAMEKWLDGTLPGMITDGTRTVPVRETGTVQTETRISNRVISINPFFGNAFIGFHPDELAAWGLQRGDFFLIETHGELRRVYYGLSYGDVPLGEWVAFPTASDTILLARNHESAAETARLNTGDEVSFLRLKTEK
ncbi:MAG: hypothetical protein EA360_06755 [Balneolaceae bacterium]|nr:MAG: hypothetical protein EA360_06755 [Balneolaceae bacterium]